MYVEHFHPFGFLFFFLIVGLLVTNLVLWKRRGSRRFHNPYQAKTILENRLAKGEITSD
ncbi:hypothetical protein VBD025_07060 [Virgibacillus flavescens]|uniref:hypothetical protein n=1 Tax=Virgibacillus flavescens TaxID=1611422 RepID=UPI003D3573E5